MVLEKMRKKCLSSEKLDSTATLNLLTKALGETSDQAAQEALLRGIVRGLEGRRSVAKPEGWSEVSESLRSSGSGGIGSIARQLDQIFGDQSAADRAIAQLKNKKVAAEER